jgi:hypothetical protein
MQGHQKASEMGSPPPRVDKACEVMSVMESLRNTSISRMSLDRIAAAASASGPSRSTPYAVKASRKARSAA